MILGQAPLYAAAYESYQWRDVIDPLARIQAPTIGGDEKISMFEPPLRVRDRVLTILHTKNVITILVLSLSNGTSERIAWTNGPINGWTIDESGNVLVLSEKSLLTIEPTQFTEIQRREIPEKVSGRVNLVALNGSLVIQASDKLRTYDSASLEKKWEYDISKDKIQRMVRGEGGKLYMASTYWGAKIREFDPVQHVWGKTLLAATPHRDLMRITDFENNLLGVYDFSGQRVFSLFLFDNAYVNLQNSTQILTNGNALRFDPIQSQTNAVATVTAKKDSHELAIDVVLPQRATYAQKIIDETFIADSSEQADDMGNRSLRVRVPALKAGETWQQIVWSGTLRRYKISFRLYSPQLTSTQKNPAEYLRYLNDGAEYDIRHPAVVGKKSQLMALTSAEYIQNVYLFAVKIPYVSGRFDPAPKVILKNNGACTEHSYAQIALLRAAGYPARLVWNYLPSDESQYTLNHKFAEVYISDLGWIPLEPLASPNSKAGTTYARHVVWATLETGTNPRISGGDRLASLAERRNRAYVDLDIKFIVPNPSLSVTTDSKTNKAKLKPVVRDVDGMRRVY